MYMFEHLTQEDIERFELILLSYVNGYCSRARVLSTLDKMCQIEYIRGQNRGISESTEKIRQLRESFGG